MAEEPKKTVRVTAGDIQQALKLGYPLTCERVCEVCKEPKHPDQFPSKRSTCKSCRRAAYKKRKAERLATGKCVYCGENDLATSTRCEPCDKKHKADNKQRLARRRSTGLCLICETVLTDRRRQFCQACFEHRAEWRRKQSQIVKAEVIAAYGNKCQCCPETLLRLLTIDHLSGGGNKHRTEIGLHGGVEFYRWLKRNDYPKEFQVLCWNCNIGRAQNGGICPHKGQA